MRLLRSHICNIFIIVCLATNIIEGIRFRTRRRINTDKLTKEDLDQFLETLLSRRESKTKQNTCVANFEEESGFILRTRDSILNGAEFINAPKDVETSNECKEECCNAVSEKSGRHCDFAVFQQRSDNPDKEQSKCFMFSCTNKNGKDVCMASPNEDYKILRLKNESVEKQLFDIAANDSVVSNADKVDNEKEDKHGDCIEQFTEQSAMIIRTRDSIRNGAEFLGAPDDVDTAEKCQSQCCTTVSKKSSRHCDFAVFQLFDDNLEDEQPKCYLFSCTDEVGKFNCITSSNDDYVTLKRTIDVEEDQLRDIASSSTIKATTNLITESTTSTELITETTTQGTRTSMTTTTTSTKPTQTPMQKRTCTRLEWKCDDGSCIKVTEVCNGKWECKDKSDELGCDAIIDTKYTSKILTLLATSTTPQAMTSTRIEESTTSSAIIKPEVTPTAVRIASSSISATNSIEQHISKSSNLEEIVVERTEPHKGAVLPLALGLSVTACVLFMVACRYHIMKKKLKRRGKPLAMEESDYLINGMYL